MVSAMATHVEPHLQRPLEAKGVTDPSVREWMGRPPLARTDTAQEPSATRAGLRGYDARGAPGPTPDDAAAARAYGLTAADVQGETVEALLENAKVLAHDEETRGVSLKQRAAWLVGFQGVILGIVLSKATSFAEGGWGAVGTPLAGVATLLAVFAILHSVRPALRVLGVVQLWHVRADVVRSYPTYGFICKSPTQARGEMLHGWARQFAEERAANDNKATELEEAFRRITGAFLVLAALVLIVCARTLGL